MHVLVLLQARIALGLLHARTVSPLTPVEAVSTYRWQTMTNQHHFCANCGYGTYGESSDWSTGEPDFEHPRIGINARLFDDFDLGAAPVTVIDGKNLW
jgi:hypothetical protein